MISQYFKFLWHMNAIIYYIVYKRNTGIILINILIDDISMNIKKKRKLKADQESGILSES